MYLKDVEISKKVHIVGLNNENIKQLTYLFNLVPIKAQIGREILKLFQKMYLILRYQIVGTSTLCNLSVHFNPIDFGTSKVAKCTDNFILSACVQRPLRPSHTGR